MKIDLTLRSKPYVKRLTEKSYWVIAIKTQFELLYTTRPQIKSMYRLQCFDTEIHLWFSLAKGKVFRVSNSKHIRHLPNVRHYPKPSQNSMTQCTKANLK